ncbi:MAG: hydantoinase/carbamoylase family amidase [Thermoleophilia bacterium]
MRLALDGERFWETVEQSGRIGVGRPGGLARLALSDADCEARDLFVTWCRAAGLAVTVDRMGSIFARREGAEPGLAPVLFGSHLDSQANGGRFDGPVGLLAGLELLRALDDAGVRTRRPLVLVNWTNEEGARFSPAMVASGVFAGVYELDWALARRADDGATLGDELERIGYAGSAEPGFPIDAYVELHIEQGPRLEAEGVPVGVVTGGYVVHGWRIELEGETAHTGPWPMEQRRNALVGAARIATLVDDVGQRHAATEGKATVNRLVASPNKPGTLSDWAELSVDVRHEDRAVADAMRDEVDAAIAAGAAAARVEPRVLDRWHWGGEIFDRELVGLVRETARGLGHATLDLPSQAGHDAYHLATVAPAAMLFSPCRGGITHNHREETTLAEQLPAVETLAAVVLARADRP